MANDSISEEDKALFRQMMNSVKPLSHKKTIDQPLPQPPPVFKTIRRVKEEPIRSEPAICLSSYYQEEVQSQTILSYLRHGIPARRFRELKTGQIYWQAKLDLHGLKIETARDTLLSFIMRQYKLDNRCVLIIHGKGGLHGEPPVLKNLVNHWLKQIPAVLAFHSAQPKDGGSGALYVLLKRRREEDR